MSILSVPNSVLAIIFKEYTTPNESISPVKEISLSSEHTTLFAKYMCESGYCKAIKIDEEFELTSLSNGKFSISHRFGDLSESAGFSGRLSVNPLSLDDNSRNAWITFFIRTEQFKTLVSDVVQSYPSLKSPLSDTQYWDHNEIKFISFNIKTDFLLLA